MVGDEGVKRKSFAVFEHVVAKKKQKRKRKKFQPHRFSDDESSPSESELVIDDEAREEVTKRKTSSVRVRFTEETLNLCCAWDSCDHTFDNTEKFYQHLINHVQDIQDNFACKWTDCPNPNGLNSIQLLIRHISFHGYLSKLINIGENVINRNNLPECNLSPNYSIEINENGYRCEWDACFFLFNTLHEFFCHIGCHILGAPSGKDSKVSVIIPCEWKGCNSKFSTRYKLADHIRIHTKERTIACPRCVTLFSTKTTFCDHRKRQLKTNLRSFQCSQCLKLFPSERILSDHMRSHINQYKCTMCDMTSTKPSMLAKHYRYKHMDVRPFSCPYCDKTFVARCNLNTHLLTHQNKPFKCSQCDFGCKSKVGLENHLVKVHSKEKTKYECQVCKIFFERGDNLTNHLIKMHKFHWPSGHSRFRYRKDEDGICRLQTVRYESLEVTEEMIKSESMKPIHNPTGVTYNVTYNNNEKDGFKLTVLQKETNIKSDQECSIEKFNENAGEQNDEVSDGKEGVKPVRNIIITIEDVDEEGHVIKSEVLKSSEIVLVAGEDMSQTIENRYLEDLDDALNSAKILDSNKSHDAPKNEVNE